MLRSAARMALVVLTLATLGWSQSSEKVIFSFDGDNGRLPDGGLVADARGNLYGTTFDGGASEYGNVFELTPVALGTWRETVLYTFNGTDGAFPESTLVLDSDGNIYGTAQAGGAGQCVSGASGSLGCGVVFKLSKNGDTWQETVLYSFQPGVSKGTIPVGGVIFDNAGNLYGTTWAPGVLGDMVASKAGKSPGGSYWGCTLPGCGGTVYKLTPTQNGWQETDIYAFTGGADGAAPLNNLTIDSAGNLYGTTPYGGSGSCQYGCGTVFKLSQSNGNWTETVMHSFAGSDGAAPTGAVVFDQSGNLFSTTSMGGTSHQGTVFELTPNGQQWNESVLHSFTAGNDGANPYAGVVLDSHGNLYGTAAAAGQQLVGTVYRMSQNGGQWGLTVLHTFRRGSNDANSPYGQILFYGRNLLIGTSQGGGIHQAPGAVYQLLQPF